MGRWYMKRRRVLPLRLVPRPGLEPGWVAPLVFETSASTDSAIWAFAAAKVRISEQITKRNNIYFVFSSESTFET